MAKKKFTDLQQKFISEYLEDQNGTKAYMRASPKVSEKVARAAAARLLANVSIQEEIQRRMDALLKKIEVTPERILQEIAYSAFVDPAEFFDENKNLLHINDMPEHVRRAIGTVKVSRGRSGEYDEDGKPIIDTIIEIKPNDKSRNLELLGKNHVLFTDKMLHEGKIDTGADANPLDTANRILHFLKTANSRMPKDD